MGTPRRWIVAALGTALFAGCSPALTAEQRTWMLEQRTVWQPRALEYAAIAKAAYRDSGTDPDRKIVPIPVGDDEGTKAYILRTDAAKRRYVVGIEGTRRDVRDFLTDGRAIFEHDARLDVPLHRGFAAVARAVYADIVPRLDRSYTVAVTGHSLGGAAAVILAMYLQQDGFTVDEVVTFGQPMVTTAAGVERHQNVWGRTVRVVACDDVIPFLPLPPYAAGGQVFLLLDPARFEFAEGDIDRPFVTALRDDFRNILKGNQAFYGHRVDDYSVRLGPPRTEPSVYSRWNARHCSGKSPVSP